MAVEEHAVVVTCYAGRGIKTVEAELLGVSGFEHIDQGPGRRLYGD